MLSRVADALYWMGRYGERVEHMCRLVAVLNDSALVLLPEDTKILANRVNGALYLPRVEAELDLSRLLHSLLLAKDTPISIMSALSRARENGRQVREQISTEMWERLNRLYLDTLAAPPELSQDQSVAYFCRQMIDGISLFSGLTDSTMRHGEGWHFIRVGRYIERGQLIARLLDVHYGAQSAAMPRSDSRPGYMGWRGLLRMCGAFEAYCKVHTANITPDTIAEFLILDAAFPRSIRFSVANLEQELNHIAPQAGVQTRAHCERLAGRLRAQVDFGSIDEILATDVHDYLGGIQDGCNQIHNSIVESYFDYDAAGRLPA